jgi:hypothetical protein
MLILININKYELTVCRYWIFEWKKRLIENPLVECLGSFVLAQTWTRDQVNTSEQVLALGTRFGKNNHPNSRPPK